MCLVCTLFEFQTHIFKDGLGTSNLSVPPLPQSPCAGYSHLHLHMYSPFFSTLPCAVGADLLGLRFIGPRHWEAPPRDWRAGVFILLSFPSLGGYVFYPKPLGSPPLQSQLLLSSANCSPALDPSGLWAVIAFCFGSWDASPSIVSFLNSHVSLISSFLILILFFFWSVFTV